VKRSKTAPPGDLYLTITLTDVTAPGRPLGGWLVAGLVMVAALLAMAFIR
jgi:hypothetical protein